jgi:tRNA (Thr-GGU) A37 N-methylase
MTTEPENRGLHMIAFSPVGTVRSPFADTAQIPRGAGAQHRADGVLELRPELEPGSPTLKVSRICL